MKSKFLSIANVSSEEEFYKKYPTEDAFFAAHPQAVEMKKGGNVPTNAALWSKAKSAARAKYDVYPSAYANGFAAKWYKERGGGWRKAEYGMEVMGEGGVPNNPGFNALPQSVQDKIMSNMAHGGAVDLNAFYDQPRFVQTNIYKDGGEPEGSMALTQINAMMDRLQNLRNFITQDSELDPWISDKLSVMNHSATAINDFMAYGEEGGQEQPEMKNGGYTVTRSNDRKGKTHKVTGPDGTVKYFGDSKLGQHPKDPERKAAFYARHKENLEKNPYFRAFARETWAEGGNVNTAPVNTFMSPGVNADPRFEQYYNQQIQKFNQSGVKEVPSRNDIYSYYQSSAPVAVPDQTGRIMFSNPQGKIAAGSTFTQAVDPMTGQVIKGGTNLEKTVFDRQAQRFDFGGTLPQMAYGEETPLVFTPEAQKQFAKSNASWGYHGEVYKAPGKVTPPLPTGTPMFYADVYNPGPGLTSGSAPVSGQPFVRDMSQPTIKADVNSKSVTDLLQNPPVKGQTFERNTSPNFKADVYQGDPGLTSGAMMGMGPEIQLPANEKMQYAWTAGTEFEKIPKAPVAAPKTELGAPKAYGMDTPSYRTYNNNGSTNGLFNNRTYDALSMMAMLPLGNRGLAGIMKAGIGTAGFVGGLGTGVDNIYRGFKPRVSYDNTNQYATPEMMQENPVYEMNRKQNTPFTPPKFTPGIPVPQTPMDEMRNTAAYGGEMPQYDFAGPVDQQRRWGLDPDGVSRALGAAAGLGMVNDVVGYNQAFNNFERNQVRAGMSDMRGVSNPYMQQGYDVLNTGPGQTQAPNLYTPMQFSGNRSAGFFEEGGEYEMTEEQLRQFLANGGEVEYL